MASVSGFDPFMATLDRRVAGAVSFEAPRADLASGRFARWVSKLRSRRRPPVAGKCSSPFVQERHEELSFRVLQACQTAALGWCVLSVAENQFGAIWAAADAAIRERLLVCVHQPPAWHRLHWRRPEDFEGIGAVVCLSRNQCEFFSGITAAPSVLIRHGVRHDFFRPADDAESHPNEPRLLFVGQWLRDFDTLYASMQHIWARRSGVCLDCVVPRHARSHPSLLKLAADDRVTWHADIGAAELVRLYQRAALLFLPVIDATANNAVVEALACGVPVVSSDAGGMGEYISPRFGQLCPREDFVAHAEAVLEWLDASERRVRARVAARAFAEQSLDWGRIAADFLQQLASLGR